MLDAKTTLAVALGAAIGGILRLIVGQAFLQRFGLGFPYGTLFINVSGSFLIGIITELAVTRSFGVTPLLRIFAATGILGGYTTFSTFSLEGIALLGEGATLTCGLYAAASVFLGLLSAYAGQAVARLMIR